MSEQAPDVNTVVSVESHGRVLSGAGADADQLAETMERHAPPEEKTAGSVAHPDAAPVTSPEAPAVPPVSRGRARYADLVREREEARAETAKERSEREAIAKENAELRARISQPPPQERRDPESAPRPPQGQPFPTFDEFVAIKGNEDADWYAYSDERTRWQYTQMRASERAEESRLSDARAVETHLDRYKTELDEARKTIPDIETAIAAVPPGSVSKVIERAVIEAGPRAAYWLATHAEERDALTQDTLVHPDDPAFKATVAATRRYLAAVTAEKPAAPTKPAWTPPPSPHPTVGASSPTTATPSSDAAKKGDYEAYRSKRAAERGVKARY